MCSRYKWGCHAVVEQVSFFSKKAQMETTPVVLNDVIYDTKERKFFCSEEPSQPLQIFEFIAPFSKETIISSDIYYVERPTYLTDYLHYCFGHAYVDITIPLLSILYEYSPKILKKRDFQLFVFKDTFKEYTTDENIISIYQNFEGTVVDYVNGTYTGSYSHFHKCLSTQPIIFEKAFSSHRYIHFNTIIYNGNRDFQRAIHNSITRYPHRALKAVASDNDIRKWLNYGKKAFIEYLGINQIQSSDIILFIGRTFARRIAPKSQNKLTYYIDTEITYLEDYSLSEQIKLFMQAKIIISSHGSGLCHLIWCQPGTKVIEIFATNDSRKIIFESYAKFLDLSYVRIECSDEIQTTDMDIEIPDCLIQQIINETTSS